MIQLIHDFCCPPLSRTRRARFAPARSLCLFLSTAMLFLMGALPSFAATPFQSSDNAGSRQAPAPAVQQSPAPASNPAPTKPDDKNPSQKSVHQKKVLTEDDLTKPSKPISLHDLDGEENNPMCDLSCETMLRQQLGFGPEREAEFRNQLTLARHEISYDKIWNSHLGPELQAVGEWCEIQRQKAKILGNSAVASYTRDSVNSRFAEREQKLILQHRNESGYLTQHIESVQRFAPFRATVMQYQVSEATTRMCPDYTMP